MYVISKEFHFSASHRLDGLPANHPCGRLHGHNYVVIMHLAADKLDGVGFVQDYGELKDVKEYIDSRWDHKHLNDQMSCNPTAENMAELIFQIFCRQYPKLIGVTVKETPKTEATYWHQDFYKLPYSN